MEYSVIEGTLLCEFIDEVNQYITDGWIPQGGIVVISDALGVRYYQSFVKIK